MNANVTDIINAQYLSEKHLNLLKPLELFLPWVPTLDGTDLTMEALVAFTQGDYAKVPMIFGTVSEEALMFIYLASKNPVNSAVWK